MLVGGQTAEFVDLNSSLADRLPVAAVLVVAAMLVLLFLAFGSVVLPVKAVLVNVLSLSAMFGGLVWIFQDGNLAGLLGIDTVGPIESTQPILILALAFGLSMDYEVFLLSRIREQWDLTGDNALAVETGLRRTGGLITSAAVLFMVVVGAFATSGVVFIQMIGVGLVLAVAIDATLVRGLLVPAAMHLMGRPQLVGAAAAAAGVRPVRRARAGRAGSGRTPGGGGAGAGQPYDAARRVESTSGRVGRTVAAAARLVEESPGSTGQGGR